MNVEDYLKRIDYTGPREPTLDTLKALCIAHNTSVPYSNYAFFGGPKCVMDYNYMYNTIVTRKQGDICYVTNGLFGWLLRKLGFEIKNGQGRFWSGHKFLKEYSHLAPVAVIDGEKWLYDVAWMLYEPLKLEMMKPQVLHHGIFRIREIEESWFVLERFRKTVIDEDGNVLKGPKLPGGYRGQLDSAEMRSFDREFWTPMHQFKTEDNPISAFSERTNFYQVKMKSCHLQQMLVGKMFLGKKGLFKIYDGEFVVKEFVDPLTDKIILKKKVENDQEAILLFEQYSNAKIDHSVNFYGN